MNLKAACTALVFLVLSSGLQAQYPKNYFSYPLDPPMVLIGTFGEIRTDHFHTGLDLSTEQDEEKNVYAAADGYVSRIKVSADGFGKALYITHPNGYVTVYAHLKRFYNEVQHRIIEAQYNQKSYEIELKPNPKDFRVKKGDLIGLSGSTGDVSGPHLHFEIRDEKSEEPINPLLFGLPVLDTIVPKFSKVRIFPMPGQGIVNFTDTPVTYTVLNGEGNATINTTEYVRAYGMVGFGVETTDHQLSATDANLGIYYVKLNIDSIPVFEYTMDRLNFNDLRYSNAHIDYESKVKYNSIIQRCFRLPGDKLKIYSNLSNGYFNFTDDNPHTVDFVVRDFRGNTSTMSFLVISSTALYNQAYQPVPAGAMLVSNEKGIAIHKPNIEISIPAGAVYDNFQFMASESALNDDQFSPVYHIGDRYVPIHTFMTVEIKPHSFPDSLKPKAILVSIDDFGNKVYEGGSWSGNFFSAKVRHFGDFTLSLDTTAPVIRKEYYPADLNSSRGAVIQFMVTDSLSGIKSYTATVDGKWLLMEYNKRDNIITGDISAYPTNKTHAVVLTVTDEKGNEAKLNDTFYY